MARGATGTPAAPAASAGPGWGAVLCVTLSLALRCAVMPLSHSGQGKPPMHGDFEAQRHWMEVTTALPLHEWYVNTTNNNLLYWGLDYPPLTAAHSYLAGLAGHVLHPPVVAWESSRGYEGPEGKTFMRGTVLVADMVVLIPAVWAFAAYLRRQGMPTLPALCSLLLHPALILIDHAHFQYNGVSLGLTLSFVTALLEGRTLLACALFTCALNYKQMTLYYAPAVFAAVLSVCVHGGTAAILGGTQGEAAHPPSLPSIATAALLAGMPVLLVFAVCWLPFCVSASLSGQGTCLSGLTSVLSRMFPVGRGLFEDKVANVWCVVEPVLKLRGMLFGQAAVGWQHRLVLALCTGLTTLLMTPALVGYWRAAGIGNTHRKGHATFSLLLCLFCVSLSFFLGSYQVHEKSILLPALPAAALAGHAPVLSNLFLLASTWSMWPLYRLDGFLPAALALCLLACIITFPAPALNMLTHSTSALSSAAEGGTHMEAHALQRVFGVSPGTATLLLRWVTALTYLLLAALSVAAAVIPAPPSLPDLHPYVASVASAGLFLVLWAWGTALLWVQAEDGEGVGKGSSSGEGAQASQHTSDAKKRR